MALKLRKDIKKSSYYVWFLGAKESKGLRGTEYIIPVIKHLEEREKDVEPFKVTLQVSHKGLKIIQNIVSQGQKNAKTKNETIKHFIPHNTITCVYQHEDVIACILLLFNPVTKCPLHVHAYRCDSLETATLLKQQLQTLIEKPENQKKFAEIENRLKPQKELKKVESSIGSDTGTSTRESESSEERFAMESTRVTTLYDSVAAELREKLGKKNSPILLPPRDYDTVHRQKGNLTGIELRRCLNANIVGQNGKGRRLESSGGSSGIGSDHPPSPESPDAPDSRFNTLDNHSTSDDDDWNGDPGDSTVYLMHGSHQVTLPRPLRNQDDIVKSPEPAQRFSRYAHDDPKPKQYEEEVDYRKVSNKNSLHRQELSSNNNITKYLEKPIAKYSNNKYLERQKSIEKERDTQQQMLSERDREKIFLDREREKNFIDREFSNRLNRALESKSKERESRRFEEERKMRNERQKPVKYFEDDGFQENVGPRNGSSGYEREKYSYDEEEFFEEKRPSFREYPVPKTRQKFATSQEEQKHNKLYYQTSNGNKEFRPKYSPNDPKYYSNSEPESPRSPQKTLREFERDFERKGRESKLSLPKDRDYFEETTVHRKNPQFRQRSPSPEEIKAPRDRFKNAKEKFLLLERERLEQERRRPEPPISPTIQKEKFSYIKRNDSMPYSSKEQSMRNSFDERFYTDSRGNRDDLGPKPAPRHIPEEVRYREYRDRDVRVRERDRDGASDRYRNTDKFDPKRRSMFSLIEEEHMKNSKEIAKELKRRSYMDVSQSSYDESVDYRNHERELRHFHDLPESERYNPPLVEYSKSSIDVEKMAEPKYDPKFVKNPQKIIKTSAGYRHSYAEPKLRLEKNGSKKDFSELLHRTSSSVSNNGRVGIASVHPY